MATTITNLPIEVIDIILSYNVITFEDIVNFRCVCKKFCYAATHEKFMERKLTQRWPTAKKACDLKDKRYKKQYKGNVLHKRKIIDFKKKGIYYANQLKNYLSRILFEEYYNIRSRQNNYNYPIDEFMKLNKIDKRLNWYFGGTSVRAASGNKRMKFSFYVDETRNFLIQTPRGLNREQIEKYCNINESHYEKLYSIKSELARLLKGPEKKQLLEKTITLMAQYVQLRKDVCYSSVNASLDRIADEVLNCLREKHPDHSIFSTSDETFSYWKNNNIDDNHWNEVESTQIMDILQEYIFGKLNFRSCSDWNKHFDCLCIDYVLENKCGEEIVVVTIFCSVARRLGLRCDIIWFDLPLCIFWKSKYIANNIVNERCFYIENKKYPDCLVNHLLRYKNKVSISSSFIKPIHNETVYLWIIMSHKQLIRDHLIFTELIKVKWQMLCNYNLLSIEDIS